MGWNQLEVKSLLDYSILEGSKVKVLLPAHEKLLMVRI
jgi:hypothetical protein